MADERVFVGDLTRKEFRERMEEAVQTLSDDLTFLERINKGGESMAPEDQARVRRIAETVWIDAHGQRRPLLSEDEVNNLCIPRGTLTEEERRIINGHMDITLEMLESLPFPRKLRRVPEYAGGHHERMDGRGFPRGLTREQIQEASTEFRDAEAELRAMFFLRPLAGIQCDPSPVFPAAENYLQKHEKSTKIHSK